MNKLILFIALALVGCGDKNNLGDPVSYPVAQSFGTYFNYVYLNCGGGDTQSCKDSYIDNLGYALYTAYGAKPFDFKQCALTSLCLYPSAYEAAYRGY